MLNFTFSLRLWVISKPPIACGLTKKKKNNLITEHFIIDWLAMHLFQNLDQF